MKRLLFLFSIFAVLISAVAVSAQTKSEPYWFFAKPELAKRKTIPVGELTACMLGDTLNPSVKGKFKKQITATALNRARLLESGDCDVALAFDDRPDGLERITRDQTGFAIYKISGDNLVLIVEPVTEWIAVGRMELASQQTLEKKRIAGCGDPSLNDIFRPNPRIWKDWTQKYVKFEDVKTQSQKDQLNGLMWDCDIWIFTPADYKRFSKVYGANYPLFSVTPESDTLTRKK